MGAEAMKSPNPAFERTSRERLREASQFHVGHLKNRNHHVLKLFA